MRPTIFTANRTVRRSTSLLAIVLVLAAAFWAARVTQAEFEVPLVDTTDFIPTEFRSVSAYKRATRWTLATNARENYEAYAVGKPLASENGTTAMYRFDGQTWEKILPQGASVMANNIQLNAVYGQIDPGAGYAPYYTLGKQATTRKAYMQTINNFSEDYYAHKRDPKLLGQLILANYNVPESPLVIDFTNTSGTLLNPPPDNSELYALSQANTFAGLTLGGGMNGWLVTYRKGITGVVTAGDVGKCGYNYFLNTSTKCDGVAGNSPRNQKAQWNLFQLNDAARAPTSTDNITGVTYVNINTAYVTTSTFPLVSGQPKAPYERDCSGTQTSKLFRVDNSPTSSSNWTLLKTITGECFYGLTATVIDVPTANNGPLQTDIWIASSAGVRRLTDDNATIPTSIVKDTITGACGTITPCGREVFGVTSAYIRSGATQQLLLNGGFDSWVLPLTGANINDPQVHPTGWVISNEEAITKDAAGTCSDKGRDVAMVNRGGSNWALAIEPGLKYDTYSAGTCTGPTNANRERIVSAIQRVPLSDVNGTRYRVSGVYKVQYRNDATNTHWPLANKPVARQGGVSINCTGAYPPNNVDCPFSNKKAIRVINSAADDTTTVPGNVGGYIPFQFEFSRSFDQLNFPLRGVSGVPYISEEGMQLEIRCQATYGVRVECDDIKVEVVTEPPLVDQSVVSVYAVGKNGLTLVNNDAVGTPTAWAVDDATLLSLATGNQISLNSLVNAGGSHIFAAGSGTALFRRTPGNVSGFLWLGAAQTGTTGNAGLGWIASNCANLKNSSARSLCQRQSQSFGLSLEKDSAGVSTFSGRGWFGKQITTAGTNNDNEGLDLGTCLSPARLGTLPAAEPYRMTGSCDTTIGSATYLRCRADTTKACIRDYDCYGRCAGDEGILCLSDQDCSGANVSPAPSLSGSEFRNTPGSTLLCGAQGSTSNACTAAGWLTFNPTDLPVADRTLVGVGTIGVTYDESNGHLSGLGRFMTLANAGDPNYQANQGWVRVRGPISAVSGTKIYGAQVCGDFKLRCQNNLGKNCDLTTGGTACTVAEGKCVNAATCQFGFDRNLQSCQPAATTCTNFCGGDPSQPCSADSECASLYGNTTDSCEPIGYCSNTLTTTPTTCQSDANCTAAGSYCVKGAVCNVVAGNSCNLYGVDHDKNNGKFQGFAWSAEYGWIDFRDIQKGTTRFLQTRLGDIYSGGNINAVSSNCASSRNATYLVSARGTINNFCTELATTGIPGVNPTQGGVPVIPITSGENDYSNALGRFDLTGLETTTSTVGLTNYNKYGMEIIELAPSTVPATLGSLTTAASPLNDAAPIVLNQKVFIANCPDIDPAATVRNECSLTQALKFANSATGLNGAGILVVNGHLTIKNNLQYISSQVNDLRQLASLVIVVRGDLNIENQVTSVIGSYYVDGTIFTTPHDAATSSDNRYPLTVRGLMIARNFEFNRRFAGTVESPLPSELFIFDGRLQSNPLPGMADFASALPNSFNSSP